MGSCFSFLCRKAPRRVYENWRVSTDGRRPGAGYNTLSEAVSAWESGMRMQHDLEYAFVYQHGGDPETVAKVRSDPLEYVDSLLERVRLMAANLVHIAKCEQDMRYLEQQGMRGKNVETLRLSDVMPDGVNPLHNSSTRLSNTGGYDEDEDDRGSMSTITMATVDIRHSGEIRMTTASMASARSSWSSQGGRSPPRGSGTMVNLPTSGPGSNNDAHPLPNKAGTPKGLRPVSKRKSAMLDTMEMQQSDLYATRMTNTRGQKRGCQEALEELADLGTAGVSSSHLSLSLNQQQRPVWPKWLTDVTFPVVRFSRYGRRLERQLMLTEYHMMALRSENGQEIRTATKLTDILDVHMTGDTKFTLVTVEQTYFFESKQVAHICHQIKSRINARHALERSGFYYSGVSGASMRGHQLLAANMLASGLRDALILRSGFGGSGGGGSSDQEDEGRTRSLIDFAEDLYRAAMRQFSPETPTAEPVTWSAANVARLQAVAPGSREAAILEAVQAVLSDTGMAEGHTRVRFIDNFTALAADSPDKSPDSLRQFIESLFEYMAKKRWGTLMLLASGQGSGSGLWDGGGGGGGGGTATGQGEQEAGADTSSTTESAAEAHHTGAVVAYLLYSSIEESVFLPLETVLYPHLDTSQMSRQHSFRASNVTSVSFAVGPEGKFDSVEGASSTAGTGGAGTMPLRDKIRQLRVTRPTQTAWDIGEEFQSPQGWRQATLALALVEGAATPTRRLHALVDAMGLIFAESEAAKKETGSTAVLGADDLLPIFIYVFVFSELSHPDDVADCLWKLCHPDALRGESGYFLTLLESTVCYLRELSV